MALGRRRTTPRGEQPHEQPHEQGPGRSPQQPPAAATDTAPSTSARPGWERPAGTATAPGASLPATDPRAAARPLEGARAARPRRSLRRLLPLALVALLVGVLTLWHVPYAIMSPGPVVNTLGSTDDGTPLIRVEGHATHPTTGALDFTTVAVRGGPGYPVTLLDVLQAKVQGYEVLPVDEVFAPHSTAEQVKEEGTAQMRSSQEAATVVALRAASMTVPEKVVVAAIPQGSPADGRLHADDVVTAVDGRPVSTSGAAREAIRRHKGGDVVRFTVQRAGKTVQTQVTAVEKDGATVVGVYLAPTYDMPVKVTVSAGDVGGPSAGTMFALGIYDKLTPGALTGGRTIAGTGALDPDGTVEPIGGIAEKMAAARSHGAQFFLAPARNCDEVTGHVPDGLQVAKISTFRDALAAVTAIGRGQASSLPTCG